MTCVPWLFKEFHIKLNKEIIKYGLKQTHRAAELLLILYRDIKNSLANYITIT